MQRDEKMENGRERRGKVEMYKEIEKNLHRETRKREKYGGNVDMSEPEEKRGEKKRERRKAREEEEEVEERKKGKEIVKKER